MLADVATLPTQERPRKLIGGAGQSGLCNNRSLSEVPGNVARNRAPREGFLVSWGSAEGGEIVLNFRSIRRAQG